MTERTPRQVLALVAARALVFGAALGLLAGLVEAVEAWVAQPGVRRPGLALGAAAWMGAVAAACAAVEALWPRRGRAHDALAALACVPVGALASVVLMLQVHYALEVALGQAAPLEYGGALARTHGSHAKWGAVVGAVLGAGGLARRRRPDAPDRPAVALWTGGAVCLLFTLAGVSTSRDAAEFAKELYAGLLLAVFVGVIVRRLFQAADHLATRLARRGE